MEARSVEQTSVFEAAEQFARIEGILPAPESSHAIRVAIDEALKCKETGEEKTIVFGLTGTGYFDMMAYESLITAKCRMISLSMQIWKSASRDCPISPKNNYGIAIAN